MNSSVVDPYYLVRIRILIRFQHFETLATDSYHDSDRPLDPDPDPYCPFETDPDPDPCPKLRIRMQEKAYDTIQNIVKI